jgi:nicotinamidase/pyrazinamidase
MLDIMGVRGGSRMVEAILIGTLLLCLMQALVLAEPRAAKRRIGVVVVDVQGDFTAARDGSLAVDGTDQSFIDKVEKATAALKRKGYLIFATQDWHPSDHVSFYTHHSGKKAFDVIQINGRTQVLWPPHCVQNTENAKVLLSNELFQAIVKKGADRRFDSYSGFKDDGGANTGLDQLLRSDEIRELMIYGIATDYCVTATAMDAAAAGYKVTVIEGLCRGVAPDTTARALQEMKDRGIKVEKELRG